MNDFMDEIIKLNDFLDAILAFIKKLLVLAAVLGLVAGAVIAGMLPLISQNPVGFAILSAIVLAAGFLIGAAVTLQASRDRISKQIGPRDKKIEELEESLERLEREAAAKDAKIVEPSPKALLNLSPIIAQTMLELCEKETLPFGKAHNSVVKSIVNEEGYFERPTMMFSGHRRPSDIYRLTPKWRAFLADEKNMETLRRLVG